MTSSMMQDRLDGVMKLVASQNVYSYEIRKAYRVKISCIGRERMPIVVLREAMTVRAQLKNIDK